MRLLRKSELPFFAFWENCLASVFPSTKQHIQAAFTKISTRASIAKEKGLEPLAMKILLQVPSADPDKIAKIFENLRSYRTENRTYEL